MISIKKIFMRLINVYQTQLGRGLKGLLRFNTLHGFKKAFGLTPVAQGE
jgi:hypothetical protein